MTDFIAIWKLSGARGRLGLVIYTLGFKRLGIRVFEGGTMSLLVVGAGLLFLALLAGCQKDQVEECVNDYIKTWKPEDWAAKSPEFQAEERLYYRKKCMRAATGQ
jgi:hypothetical protein